MAKNLRSNVYEGGLTVDPSAGAGVVAAIGSILPRTGTAELWQKFGAGNTDWQIISNNSVVPAGEGVSFFGNGFDGDMVFNGAANALGGAGLSLAPAAGVYTLTRDIFANSISVSVGATIIGNAFRIFCLNTLTNNGLIHAHGGNGGAGTAVAGGAAGIAITLKVISGGRDGLAGTAPTGGGAGGLAPGPSVQLGATAGAVAAGANGGVFQGGGGGSNEIPATGGGVAALTTFSATVGAYYNSITQALTGRDVASVNLMTNGSSGGCGRPSSTVGNGGSGGSGASGGTLIIAARFIAGAGALEARGGNGGAAGGANAGGSGGGAGGTVVLITNSKFPVSNSISVAGGNGSAAGGAAGTTAGGNGGPGLIYRFNP